MRGWVKKTYGGVNTVTVVFNTRRPGREHGRGPSFNKTDSGLTPRSLTTGYWVFVPGSPSQTFYHSCIPLVRLQPDPIPLHFITFMFFLPPVMDGAERRLHRCSEAV